MQFDVVRRCLLIIDKKIVDQQQNYFSTDISFLSPGNKLLLNRNFAADQQFFLLIISKYLLTASPNASSQNCLLSTRKINRVL
jgi:hypothetical protein